MKISVVIPTYQRDKYLEATLQSLAKQDLAVGDFEIIVVNNCIGSDTQQLVQRFQELYPYKLIYAEESRRGRASALNKGIAAAKGKIIAFCDDDILHKPDWLRQYIKTFEETGADGVGGPNRVLWLSEPPSWVDERFIRQLGVADRSPVRLEVKDEPITFIGGNCAYRRELFSKLGGFDPEDPMEDAEIFLRVKKNGAKLVYEPAVATQHCWEGKIITKRFMANRLMKYGKGLGRGWQRGEHGRRFCRVPLWGLRKLVTLHFTALKYYLAGDREQALWYWLQRYTFWGAIRCCFVDAWTKRPAGHQDIPKFQN